ncbi:MAG: hypothetical protein U0269_13740 [Polyangiales bacterium]
MTSTNYGVGLFALPGQPPDELFAPVTGRKLFIDSIARRLTCPPGGLFWAPTQGIDLRAYLRSRVDAQQLTSIRQRTLAALFDDERVIDAECVVTYSNNNQSLRVALSIESAQGPFAFVLDVSAARVAVFELPEFT